MKFAPRPPLAGRSHAARPRGVAAALLAVVATGCGGSGSAPPAAPDGADAAPVTEATAAAPATAAESKTGDARFAPFTDPAGRKWLNETIPYDAFATAPAGSGGAAAAGPAGAGSRNLLAGIGSGMSVPREVNTGGARGALPTAPMGAGMGGGAVEEAPVGEDPGGWGAVISAEDLRDEIKRARNATAAAVATVAAFNRMQDDLPVEAATLAAMAQITAEHPGAVPWKPHADAVRTLAVRVGEAAGSRGRTARDEARASFDPLDSVLGGNPPPDGAVAEFDRQIDAPRGTLMQRMESALKYLQQEAPDADALAANAPDLGRQAAALAALSRFTAHEAYDNAAEPDYQGWANALTAAARDAARSARESKDYAAYRAAVDRAAAACSDCHGAYR